MLFFRLFVSLLLLSFSLFAAQELQKEYSVSSNRVMLSDIIKSPKLDHILFNINDERHTKRVKSSELIQKLKLYGYDDFTTHHGYIQFTQKSPINTEQFKNAIKKYYQKEYKNIHFKKIDVQTTKYITELPKDFSIHFSRREYLSHKGFFYIKTLQNKKIFFHYTILATLQVCKARKEIAKGEEISLKNTEKKSIMLDKFRALPLMDLKSSHYEAKHRIKKGSLITKRDIIGLYLVKRGSTVTVTLRDGGVHISFTARALKSGRYGDTIRVVHTNNKKIRVRITGRNRAEVE
jgi:flagella basal body P-ring formation protein FlgA